MDARVVLVTADEALAELVGPQAANLGATVVRASDADVAADRLDAADAVVIDLLLDGARPLAERLLDAGEPRVLVVAPSADAGGWAADRGAVVVAEPFRIVDLVEALRALVEPPQVTVVDGNVIDLRSRIADDERPWWATR